MLKLVLFFAYCFFFLPPGDCFMDSRRAVFFQQYKQKRVVFFQVMPSWKVRGEPVEYSKR